MLTNVPLRRTSAVLAAVALGATGFVVLQSSAQAADTTLISTATTTWRYFDDGTDPAAGLASPDAWTAPAFSDAAWKQAKGSFGAKKGLITGITGGYTINTLLSQYKSGTTTDKETFFFRTTVPVTAEQLAVADAATATVIYDDAASVFVNGTYVGGGDDADLQASSARNSSYGGSNADIPKTATVSIPLSLNKAGDNTIAMRLHNGRADSSDVYLDMTALTLVDTPDASASPSASASAAPSAGAPSKLITNVIMGVGATEAQRTLTWYSATAPGQSVRWAKASELVDGVLPATAKQVAAGTQVLSLDAAQTSNQVDLVGLEADTEYAYQVGSETDGWTAVTQFATAKAGAHEFLFFGDAQIGASGNAANDTANWVNTAKVAQATYPNAQLWISAGDQVNTAISESQYDGYLAPEQMTKFAWSNTIGNHDVGSQASYEQHFDIVNKDAATRDNWFVYNDVLYMVLNTNNRSTAAHKAWMQGVIAAAGDVEQKVVIMHHSMYSTASHTRDSDIIARRAELPPVFSALGIDLVLAGHDHVYARTHLLKDGTATTDGQPATVTPKQGDVMYVTANSSSASKFYAIKSTLTFPWLSLTNQENKANFTRVAASQCSIDVITHRVADLSVVDQFSMKTLHGKQTITVPQFTAIASGSVASYDKLSGVKVTDPCEPGLAATVTGEIGTAPGEYVLTYSSTDAHGNVATAERTITVVDAPVVTTTVTAPAQTVTATATITAPAQTVTATTTAPAQTVTATATQTVAGPTMTVTETVSAPTETVTATVTEPATTVTTTAPAATVTVTPTTRAPRAPYEVPGLHRINGRDWWTTCEPYSGTMRCRTEIWASTVVVENGQYVVKSGWVFNNLTYLPMTRAQWGANKLANTGEWTAADGRQWRTECDTAVTGKGACRTYIKATYIAKTATGFGAVTDWVLNNMVSFA